jgi:hypothetical protein
VLISTFLTWYSVTLTSLGVQFYESLERALFSRLFPQIAAGLGVLTITELHRHRPQTIK